jgi:hypothetical protein
MSFRIRKRSITGLQVSSPNDAVEVPDDGKGWVVGDNIIFTAGHVVYEWDRNTSTPVIRFNPNTIVYDEFDYGRTTNSRYLNYGDSALISYWPVTAFAPYSIPTLCIPRIPFAESAAVMQTVH